MKIFNFSAGPAMLPSDVLKQAQRELRNWHGIGASVMEISHRSKYFIKIIKEAEKDLRYLLNIPTNYKVLFCHGGGRGQFSALPLNLLGNKNKADYIESGYWSASAIKEAKKYCKPNVIKVNKFSVNSGLYSTIPMQEWQYSQDSAYMYYCPNETIEGIAINETPNFGDSKIITADFSSTILSSPLDVSKFGLIFASTQKNIGPAGLALVIIKEDLLGKVSNFCPSIFNYTLLNDNNSMFNTPPTFTWYLVSLVFKWLKNKGGIAFIDALNKQKAELLYSTIDKSDLYYNNVAKANRSRMNVPFQLTDNSLEEIFLKKSELAGLLFLKGHRAIGGMRASIYNAMPLEGVETLTYFMTEFERRYG